MTPARVILLTVLLTGANVLAAEAVRPHCDSKHAGDLWPDPKTSGTDGIPALARSGDLEVCSRTSTWRYRWTHVTVTLNDLRSKKKHTVQQSSDETGLPNNKSSL